MSSYKNIALILSLVRRVIDSGHSWGNYKSLKVSTGATIKNPEMLRFIPDYLKNQKDVKTCS